MDASIRNLERGASLALGALGERRRQPAPEGEAFERELERRLDGGAPAEEAPVAAAGAPHVGGGELGTRLDVLA